VLDKFDFDTQITRLARSNLLYLVVSKFAEIDLHPDKVSNLEMGYLYEELIRRFSELPNKTAGEHFPPREVIRLMVNLLFIEDEDLLTKPGIVKTMLDQDQAHAVVDPRCCCSGRWVGPTRRRPLRRRQRRQGTRSARPGDL
jgi:type I restriction-modification system DNA methylase subunit